MAKSQHATFFPVYRLELTDSMGGEIQIENVTYVSAKKIPRIRKRLGLKQPISFYKNKAAVAEMNGGSPLFEEAKTYACVKTLKENSDKDISHEIQMLQDSFWLLCSGLHCTDWRQKAALSLRPTSRENRNVLILDRQTNGFGINTQVVGSLLDNVVDHKWKQHVTEYHFYHLLKLLASKNRVERSWKDNIRRAAILQGKSFQAKHVAEAFTYNMIAIETLLARQGDKHQDVLKERIATLFDWLDEQEAIWPETVDRLYKLRCNFVHDGKDGEIQPMDLYFSDVLLRNLLLNICLHWKHIKSKDDIVLMAERKKARKVLRLNKKLGVNFCFITTQMNASVRKKINDVDSWSY